MQAPALRVTLLGELSLSVGGTPLPPLESGRAASLLAYLLLHRDAPQPRARIAGRLWPDSSEAQARTNLRHVRHTLRHSLPDAQQLEATARTLRWRGPVDLDVARFEAALARGALEEAVDAYGGDPLEGSYDAWLLDERDRLRGLYLEALERLATTAEGPPAIAYAERLLRADPLREDMCRLLMRLHDARGDTARGLRVYHACAAALGRALGVGPSAADARRLRGAAPRRRARRGGQPAGGADRPRSAPRSSMWTCRPRRSARAWTAPACRAGELAATTDVVQVLTGRPPRDIAAFARDHADAFTPLAPPVR